MLHTGTYPLHIGTIARPTPEERSREAERWVSLRTLSRASVPAGTMPAPCSSAQPPAPSDHALLRAVDRRHAEARRKLGL